MRIAINCRSFLLRQYAGIGRYASNLVKHLSEIDSKNEYYLYAKKGIFDFRRQFPRIRAKNFIVKSDYFNSGLNKTLGPTEVYHSPSPDLLEIDNTKIVVTIHDLVYKAFPQGHTQSTLEMTEKQMQGIIKKATRMICVSQSTRNDLHKFFSIDKSKTSVVYHGVDKNEFFPLRDGEYETALSLVRSKGVEGPYLLSVGTIEPRKNLENILFAFSLLKSKKKFNGVLVCIGAEGWMTDRLGETIKQLNLAKDVVFLGYVTNRELRYFYNLAEAFVFPSFYEGFGFPILEAFHCKAAVVTSNVSSCPEIAGDAALIVNPQKFEEIAAAIERFLVDKNFKSQMQQRAIKRAGDFSFLNMAKETLKVYEAAFQG